MRISLNKLKDMPKLVKDVLINMMGLDEEKDINEPQELSPQVKEILSLPIKNQPMIHQTTLSPLGQMIEIYEVALFARSRSVKLDAAKLKLSLKLLNIHRNILIETIKYLIQAGADPALLYPANSTNRKENLLIRTLHYRLFERFRDKIPSLFSTILNYSPFDVNKPFYDENIYKKVITPLVLIMGSIDKLSLDFGEIQELLAHPDIEINTGHDLLSHQIITKHDPKITQLLLDFGYHPEQQINSLTVIPMH